MPGFIRKEFKELICVIGTQRLGKTKSKQFRHDVTGVGGVGTTSGRVLSKTTSGWADLMLLREGLSMEGNVELGEVSLYKVTTICALRLDLQRIAANPGFKHRFGQLCLNILQDLHKIVAIL